MKCHVCGRERPEEMTEVFTRDVSAGYGVAEGTLVEHIRYCVDAPACIAGAKDVHLIKEPEEEPHV